MSAAKPLVILATRGSALALAQTNLVQAQCRAIFPDLQFETKIIKTTGDKLQTVPVDDPSQESMKGLFTKELEIALLNREADLAVHSLKDLPTELPVGLKLGAVTPRADVRDVLIYRGERSRTSASADSRCFPPQTRVQQFPPGALIATSSTRRQAQLLALHPGLKVAPIRGNVGTRLQKLAERSELDGLILAAAGLERLKMKILPDGRLASDWEGRVPEGLFAVHLAPEEMLPCVGQGALGIETRVGDERTDRLCAALNDPVTFQCVTAERAFLRAMGGGCLSPVAAYGEISDGRLRLRAVSFRSGRVWRGQKYGSPTDADALGVDLAGEAQPDISHP